MCGICGYVGIEDPNLLGRMLRSMVHRGPDGEGAFRDGDVTLGHRRLAIIDLGGGAQPMSSPDGRYHISFNGEIYNFRELREQLTARGETFRTNSDTEVLLRLFQREGIEGLSKLNGMFAFAVFDRETRELFLVRDRVGIKPLYYAELGGKLLFASETKALLQYAGLPRDINPDAVKNYLALRYVPGDRTILAHVRRLPPGHYMKFKNGRSEIRAWWHPPTPHRSRRSEADYLDELSELMHNSVRRRLISDVSFGAYLSGGLDSSVIVALMSKLTNAAPKTFSVGFDYKHDELSQAADTARLLGCDHTEVACRAKDIGLLEEAVRYSDDPLGDPITIPMFQLAREAKKKVTVILTGEGADEMFGGYLFHKVMWGADLYRELTPGPLRRRVIKPAVSALPASWLNTAFRYPADLGERGKLKAVDYLDVLENGNADEGYRHLISLFDNRELSGLFSQDFSERLRQSSYAWRAPEVQHGDRFDQMLQLQYGHWLPDNMLLRQDKMGMAWSIEGRVPFLDHELMEFAFRLPRKFKLRKLTGKYLLRQLGATLLPKSTAHRAKMPFYVPIEEYFQDAAFVDQMGDLLSERAVEDRGIFDPRAVASLATSMRNKEFLLVKQAFSLMTLELWFRAFVDETPDCASFAPPLFERDTRDVRQEPSTLG